MNNEVKTVGIDKKEEINVMKEKFNNFGKGVMATYKNKSYYKESAKGALWGIPIGLGIEYLGSRNLKKSSVVIAKRIPGALLFGVTVSAVLNGLVAIDNPDYVDYLEED